MFEGLFVRGIKPQGEFLHALREVGFDPEHVAARYPLEIWNRCLELCIRHGFPGLPAEEAECETGRTFAKGYLNTLIGSMSGAALPVMGPEAMVERMPKYVALGRDDVQVRLSTVCPRSRKLFFAETCPRPYFTKGAMQVGLERARAKPEIVIEDQRADGYTLFVKW